MWLIYKHQYNNKVYIGLTRQTPEQRWRNGEGYKNSPHFYRAIKKYGWDNFTHEIIQSTDSLEKAQILEIMWISFYKKRGGVYNITAGGEGSNGVPMSEDTKKKISLANKGKNSWNKGQIGIKWTEEQKKKASASHKGQKPWNTGKSGYSIKSGKPVLQYSIDGEFIKEWSSANQVQAILGFSASNIHKVCKGEYKQSYGFRWQYHNII